MLEHFNQNGRGVLVYLRRGAASARVARLDGPKSAAADRSTPWREIGVGAEILRDLGVLQPTSSVHDHAGLSGYGLETVCNEQLER